MSATPIPQSANDIIGVTRGSLDSMNMWLIILAIMACAFFVAFAYIIIDKYRTPRQASNLTKAHRKHIPMILLAGLDHFADLYPLTDFIPEVLQSFPFGKGAKKRTYRFVLPQKKNVMDDTLPVEAGKNEYLTKRYIQTLNDLNTQSVTLRGVNSPMFAGVKNRSLAASFGFLGALSWTKDIEGLVKKPAVIDALCNSGNTDIRQIGETLRRMSLGVTPIDFHAVYKNVDINWDHTINDSISERDKTDGRLERAEDKDKSTKTVLVLVLGIIGIIIAGAIVISVLK